MYLVCTVHLAALWKTIWRYGGTLFYKPIAFGFISTAEYKPSYSARNPLVHALYYVDAGCGSNASLKFVHIQTMHLS
jgi:hypothetical protein